MSFSGSPYKWLWNGYPLGIVAEAPTLTYSLQGEEITADAYGGNPIDWILQGGTAYLDIIFQEMDNARVQEILDANTGEFGKLVVSGGSAGIGCPFVASAGGVVRAYPIGNCYYWAHWIAYSAVIVPGQDIAIMMGSRLQNVPLRLQLLPWERDGNIGLFDTTLAVSEPNISSLPTIAAGSTYNWADDRSSVTPEVVRTLPEYLSV